MTATQEISSVQRGSTALTHCRSDPVWSIPQTRSGTHPCADRTPWHRSPPVPWCTAAPPPPLCHCPVLLWWWALVTYLKGKIIVYSTPQTIQVSQNISEPDLNCIQKIQVQVAKIFMGFLRFLWQINKVPISLSKEALLKKQLIVFMVLANDCDERAKAFYNMDLSRSRCLLFLHTVFSSLRQLILNNLH